MQKRIYLILDLHYYSKVFCMILDLENLQYHSIIYSFKSKCFYIFTFVQCRSFVDEAF